jgi:hypothetical protein
VQVDGVLDNADQAQVFAEVAAPLVAATLDGYNAAVLCYGQTGAGKTYSMCGGSTFDERGIVPRAIEVAFAAAAASQRAVTLKVSCLEIYNDELYDLLAQGGGTALAKLTCVEDANGTTEIKVRCPCPAVQRWAIPMVRYRILANRLRYIGTEIHMGLEKTRFPISDPIVLIRHFQVGKYASRQAKALGPVLRRIKLQSRASRDTK